MEIEDILTFADIIDTFGLGRSVRPEAVLAGLVFHAENGNFPVLMATTASTGGYFG